MSPKKSGPCGPFEISLDVLDALGRDGLVVAPHDPSPKMLRAGALAGAVDEARAGKIYIAMIEAA